jgi:predicted transcriptional regulator
MSTTKKQAVEMIKRLPETASWDDIMYEVYVRKKLTQGIAAADEGQVIPHEEVKKRFVR